MIHASAVCDDLVEASHHFAGALREWQLAQFNVGDRELRGSAEPRDAIGASMARMAETRLANFVRALPQKRASVGATASSPPAAGDCLVSSMTDLLVITAAVAAVASCLFVVVVVLLPRHARDDPPTADAQPTPAPAARLLAGVRAARLCVRGRARLIWLFLASAFGHVGGKRPARAARRGDDGKQREQNEESYSAFDHMT